jgi:rhamnosyltransferase
MTQGEESVRVAAIIAAYNPDKKVIDVFRAVVGQVDLVVVVDDRSNDSSTMPVFEELRSLGAEVIHSPNNAGIARTLNIGISRCAAIGRFDYYLTLDQDSIPDQDYVSNALKTDRLARELNIPVGFVSAATYNNSPVLGNGTLLGFEQPFDPWQSGMLIPRSTFNAVGGLDEKLVIDAVDSEFTLRVRKAGLAVLCGSGCNMAHSLGQQSTVSFWGKKRLYTYHSPVRVYYITRNNLLIFFRYFLADPIWVARKSYYELVNHSRRILFSKNKKEILRAMLFGVRDASMFRNGIIRARDMQKLS